MATIYFPSCKFTAYSPESSEKIKNYLMENFDIQIAECCRPGHKDLTKQDTVVYICNTCAAFCQESSSTETVISLWELLVNDEQFPYPNYNHKQITIQDCWRTHENISQQKAVREILKRMNIDIIELEENYDKTSFCGVSLYQPLPKQNGELAPKRFIEDAQGVFLSHSEEEQTALMKKHCNTIKTSEVACYCISCTKGTKLGGKHGIHVLDLMFHDR